MEYGVQGLFSALDMAARSGYLVNGAGAIREKTAYPRLRCRRRTMAAARQPDRVRAAIHTTTWLASPV